MGREAPRDDRTELRSSAVLISFIQNQWISLVLEEGSEARNASLADDGVIDSGQAVLAERRAHEFGICGGPSGVSEA